MTNRTIRIDDKRNRTIARVISGNGPHNILKMVQEQALKKYDKRHDKNEIMAGV